MITLLERLVGTRQEEQKKPTQATDKAAPRTQSASPDDWDMSANDALRAKTVSGYK